MNYEKLIELNYSAIKKHVLNRAFRFYINASDLQSMVNERLAVGIHKEKFEVSSKSEFWKYIHMIIYSSAVDLKRSHKHVFELLENCDKSFDPNIHDRLSAKVLINKILSEIKSDLNRQVVTEILINGEKYEDTAIKLGLKLGTVKGIVFRSREYCNAKYGKLYKEIIN